MNSLTKNELILIKEFIDMAWLAGYASHSPYNAEKQTKDLFEKLISKLLQNTNEE